MLFDSYVIELRYYMETVVLVRSMLHVASSSGCTPTIGENKTA